MVSYKQFPVSAEKFRQQLITREPKPLTAEAMRSYVAQQGDDMMGLDGISQLKRWGAMMLNKETTWWVQMVPLTTEAMLKLCCSTRRRHDGFTLTAEVIRSYVAQQGEDMMGSDCKHNHDISLFPNNESELMNQQSIVHVHVLFYKQILGYASCY